MMPHVDGFELVRRLRQDRRWRDLPVLLMSAVEPRLPRAQVRWDAFLKKPFSLDELLGAIEALLRRRRRARP
jgi:DNA-binding response OmpR family regulator